MITDASKITRAWCETCQKYPNELISWPTVMCEDEDGGKEWKEVEVGVILTNSGRATNRWEDGTIGVPPEVQEMAEADEQPICGECRGEIDWKHFDKRSVERPYTRRY